MPPVPTPTTTILSDTLAALARLITDERRGSWVQFRLGAPPAPTNGRPCGITVQVTAAAWRLAQRRAMGLIEQDAADRRTRPADYYVAAALEYLTPRARRVP